MPDGLPYFAWVDATETTFGVEHMRWDESVFSFTLEQQEGDHATLGIVVINPRVGPLSAGRKIYAWFAIDCGGGNLLKFFGRLVGVPSNLLGDTVQFDFVARPPNYEAQKSALADSLKVLPYYDPIFIDPEHDDDPDVVLEGYGAIWHIDPETHALTISDEVNGEDGTLTFGPADMLFNGLAMNITGSPATVAQIDATFAWTQLATGSVDLTSYITTNWPNEPSWPNETKTPAPGTITSFTLSESNWPKAEASIGDGWSVVNGSCVPVYDITVKTRTTENKTTHNWAGGSKTELSSTETREYMLAKGGSVFGINLIPPGSITFPAIVTQDSSTVTYGTDGADAAEGGAAGKEMTGFSRQFSDTLTVLPLLHLRPTITVTYNADRPFEEMVRFNVVSDVQPVLTEPEDGAIARLSDIKSVNLSEPVGVGSAAEVPIGDPRRRSYITTARGQESLRHLLALTRATLRKRARVVEITFEPLLARMHEITLRKNALVTDARLPGGSATGKIIGYTLALDGDAGSIDCKCTIGCAVGRGGVVAEVEGTPTYVDAAVLGPEIQEFEGRVVLLDAEEDLGFTLPLFSPGDDGLDFISGLSVEDIIEEGLTVDNPPAVQRAVIEASPYTSVLMFQVPSPYLPIGETLTLQEQRQQIIKERADHIQKLLDEHETAARFKLRSMTGEFANSVEMTVTDLKIPKMIDLEVAA